MSAVDPEKFQELASRRATGVAVVSARIGHWDHAAVVSDYLFISYDPPSLLVSLFELSRICEALEEADTWTLNLLAGDQQGLAERLAEPGAPLIGLLDRVAHTRRTEQGPAWLTGALATFECQTMVEHQVATHKLFAGRVVAQSGANVLPEPLLRFRSRFTGLPQE